VLVEAANVVTRSLESMGGAATAVQRRAGD